MSPSSLRLLTLFRSNVLLPYKHSLNTRAMVRCLSSNSLLESVVITKSCASRIKQLQTSSNSRDLALRVQVESGGCSGFQYTFKMEKFEPAEDDKVFTRDDVNVVVDSSSFDFIKGATVDFQQELIRSAFAVVNNPQSESACGCGSSFAVKNFSANPALD